jgi:hypothetical protein
MIKQMQETVSKLQERAKHARHALDRDSVTRHAEHIYNVAARNENDLTVRIARLRYPVARNFHRSQLIAERHNWKLIQDHVKEVVELLQTTSDNVGAVLHDEGRARS